MSDVLPFHLLDDPEDNVKPKQEGTTPIRPKCGECHRFAPRCTCAFVSEGEWDPTSEEDTNMLDFLNRLLNTDDNDP
jgi:hypothetical protein